MYTYEQSTGRFCNPTSSLFAIGYSGNGEGKNNPSWQGVKMHGPCPCGIYTAVKMLDHDPHLGYYAIKLEPDAATRVFIISLGRDPDSYYWHGDSVDHPGDASDGCLVSQRSPRIEFWDEDNDKKIQVIAGLPISPTTAYPRSL